MRGAFRATRGFDQNCRIGLVDDVLTTGSTLESAAEALLAAGALEVRGLTLAATLPRLASRGKRQAQPECAVYSHAASDAPIPLQSGTRHVD